MAEPIENRVQQLSVVQVHRIPARQYSLVDIARIVEQPDQSLAARDVRLLMAPRVQTADPFLILILPQSKTRGAPQRVAHRVRQTTAPRMLLAQLFLDDARSHNFYIMKIIADATAGRVTLKIP